MFRRHSIFTVLAFVAFSWLLTACGQAAAPASATAQAPQPTTSAPPTAQPTDSYADIPQGQTPEGYQALGDPAAPVTLVMYSDFL